jgi:hypothetical protein
MILSVLVFFLSLLTYYLTLLSSAYPPGSISPPFGPQYAAARYYQPLYPGPVLPQHPGSEGQPATIVPATSNLTENANKEVSNSGESNNDAADELSELVQKKLNVDGGSDKDSSVEGGDKK